MDVFTQYGWVFLQSLLNYLVPLLAAQVAVLLGAWIVKQVNAIKAKLTADQLVILNTAVNLGIQAAEQLNLAGAIKDKKAKALEIAQQYLTDHKVQINLATLDAAVESAVYAAFNQGKTKPAEIVPAK